MGQVSTTDQENRQVGGSSGTVGEGFGVGSNRCSRFVFVSHLISASSLLKLAVGSYWPEKKAAR